MDSKLYKSAVEGNKTILANTVIGDEYYLQQTFQTKNNIIHIAVGHQRYDFVKEALGKFPELVCQTNSNNDTPFHVAAKTGSILELLINCCHKLAPAETRPWRVQNSEGNTPLHIALIHCQVQFAAKLVKEDPELTNFRNNSSETPLHLAINHYIDNDRESVVGAVKHIVATTKGATLMVRSPPEGSSGDIVTLLLQKNSSAACYRNSNGLTPLLVALSCKRPYLLAIKSILNYCPQSIEVCDFSGKTMLHLLSELSFENELSPQGGFFEYLLSIPEIHGFKNDQDLEGNTPAHMAVKNQNILMVGLLLQLSTNFAIKNKDGLSAANLIQQNIDKFKDLRTIKGYNLFIPCTRIEGEKERLEMLISKLQQRGVKIEEFDYTELQQTGNVLHMLVDLSPFYSLIWKEEEVQEFIKQVLDTCPGLICETDRGGRTALHYIASFYPEFIDETVLKMFSHYFKKLEDESGVGGLHLPPWRIQDCDGDTPLHCAMYLGPISTRCVRAFLELDITLVTHQNNELQTPLHLLAAGILSSSESLKELECFKYPASVIEACELRDKDGLTPILKAAQKNLLPLVRLLYTLSRFSASETTVDGKTFWHLLAIQKYLESNHGKFEQFLTFLKQQYILSGLDISDNDGNKALHLAIQNGNFRFAQFLIENTPQYFSPPLRNNDGNTALHLAIQNGNYQFAQLLVEKDTSCLSLPVGNNDGNTALHLAIQNGKFHFAQFLIEKDTSCLSLPLRNNDGNTALHLAIQNGNFQFARLLIEKDTSCLSLPVGDNDGNTALHLAIQDDNFQFAKFLIEKDPPRLRDQNKKGLSLANLIESAEQVPRHFNDFLWSKLEIVKNMMVVRSLSGVSTSKIENYTNTIGVVAALLATVTFTAAFTVPGGLDTSTGTPLLLKKSAFQVFMVSDVVAMCLSMMVLFCLQWIITMSNKKESVVLLDLSIFLLEASLYATLLAFMTGLYVTTHHITPWVGILSCALCSSLILLMHKRFFAFSVPFFIGIFFVSRRAVLLLSEFLHLLLCGIPKSEMARCSQHVQSNENNGGSSSIGHGTSDGHDNPEVQQRAQSQPNWSTDYSSSNDHDAEGPNRS